MNMLEKVADAIREAEAGDNYCLFDYSKYPGTDAPHVVKDGYKELFRSWDAKEAKAYYYKLKNNRVAKAAIKAMREPNEKMEFAGQRPLEVSVMLIDGDFVFDADGPLNTYKAMIDEALKGE